MYQGYRIIDADAHFYEPMDIWDRYTEPEYYEQRPRVIGNVSRSRLEYAVDGVHFTGPTRKIGVEQRYKNQAKKYGHAYDSWWSLESRVKDMDSYGWDLQVCLPTGGGLGTNISRKDLKLGAALCRAYNNWARDFCSDSAGRVKFAAVVPGEDVEEQVIETRRAVEKLGALTIILPTPAMEKEWHRPDYDPLWETAVDLDLPLSIHGVLSRSGDPPTNLRYQDRGSWYEALFHAMDFPFENMASLGHFMLSGILDRYPALKLSILESNCGWLPFWLNRLEKCSEGRQAVAFYGEHVKASPQEYFQRQCFIACDADEPGIKPTIEYAGDGKIVFNTDYPHFDAPDPSEPVPQMIAQPIADESKRRIFWDNAIALYGTRLLEGVTVTEK